MHDRTRAARLPAAFLAALALIASIERHLEGQSYPPIDKPEIAWHFAAEASVGRVAERDVLIFGDSIAKLGVQPLVLESILGRGAYNLAVPGGQAAASAFLLDRALQSGARPKVVLLNTDPNLLAISPSLGREHSARLATPAQSILLGYRAGDPDLIARGLLGELPSCRERDTIRSHVQVALAGLPRDRLALNAHLRRNWIANRGAQLAADEAAFHDRGRADRPQRWIPHSANDIYLDAFFRRARASGIPVVWLIPPASSAWSARRRADGVDRALDRWMASILASHPNVSLLDARSTVYPDDCFRDATHLSRRGAIRYSAALAVAIRPLLEGKVSPGRSLQLANELEPRPFEELEDVEVSRVRVAAVVSGAGAAR